MNERCCGRGVTPTCYEIPSFKELYIPYPTTGSKKGCKLSPVHNLVGYVQ